ncbi:hypothetical protein BVC80_8941g23 [Macleaya cordata]|uniref:Uncharacterized protein n=1 Tax=Macleaya cordata TaxID=56857 RepID=A0A200QRG9_MACCD|nr:hypothetical protein BVC80_8941g23 [Macleaya cordata]
MESSTAKIQHVNKVSSDQLLRKFAELGEDASKKKEDHSKRRKRCGKNYDNTTVNSESPSKNNSTSLVERRSLLPTANRRSVLLRQFGIGRSSQLRAREIKNRSLMGALEKTWRKTVEGASKVFIEKHYNRHKRLINDVV